MKRAYDPSSTIAMFIAAGLQYPQSSTISVEQHKNKFNLVTVYCTLANEYLVNESWKALSGEGSPSDKFVKLRLYEDAVHYRRIYRQMLSLIPDHDDMILSRPDYEYLLFSDIVSINAWLDKLILNETPLTVLFKKWRVIDIEAFRALMERVYKVDW